MIQGLLDVPSDVGEVEWNVELGSTIPGMPSCYAYCGIAYQSLNEMK